MNGQNESESQFFPSGVLKSEEFGSNLSGRNSSGLYHSVGQKCEARELIVIICPFLIGSPSLKLKSLVAIYPNDQDAGGAILKISLTKQEVLKHLSSKSPVSQVLRSAEEYFPFSRTTSLISSLISFSH